MNCKNCNSPLEAGATFCANCGQKVEETQNVNTEQEVLGVEQEISNAASVVNQTLQEETPVVSAPTVTQEQKKGSNIGFIIAIIILSVLVLGLGGFIAYKFLFPSTSVEPTTTTTTEPTQKEPTSTTEPATTTTTTTTTTTDDDYMVIGDSTLGYLKLPGKWTRGSIPGSSETAIQYIDDSTIGSTAKGAYIVTLNVWSKTSDGTTAQTAANSEANYYKTYDSDATNISVVKAKVGKFDAYKLSTQYKSDNVWVISWYIDGDDGLVHIIQVEGLDLTNDYFKIPETFSFTKIN